MIDIFNKKKVATLSKLIEELETENKNLESQIVILEQALDELTKQLDTEKQTNKKLKEKIKKLMPKFKKKVM